MVIWGAAAAAAVLRNGARVHLTGRLRTRSWDKDGERRYKTEVVCNASDVIVAWLPGQGDAPAETAPDAQGDAVPA